MKLHFYNSPNMSSFYVLFFAFLGASTVPAGGTQGGRASRGSYVSVTDVSSDEELDLDNI